MSLSKSISDLKRVEKLITPKHGVKLSQTHSKALNALQAKTKKWIV
jgi:hypothetical protein